MCADVSKCMHTSHAEYAHTQQPETPWTTDNRYVNFTRHYDEVATIVLAHPRPHTCNAIGITS